MSTTGISQRTLALVTAKLESFVYDPQRPAVTLPQPRGYFRAVTNESAHKPTRRIVKGHR